MTNNRNVNIRKQFDELKNRFGGKCLNCGSTMNLQFAHIKDTCLNGKGRGRKERYYDIIKNPESYVLLCGGIDCASGCHQQYDAGQLKLQIVSVVKI